MTAALDSLSAVFFPSECRVCSHPLAAFSTAPVCFHCWNDLPLQPHELCHRCGEALPSLVEGIHCRPCRAAEPPFEKAVAHGVYAGTLRALLHLLKYDGITPVAEPLGRLLAAQVRATPALPASLLVIPVPLFRAKQRTRGFNHAELLARACVRALAAPPGSVASEPVQAQLAPAALLRRRDTESQAGLSPHQRRRNLRGAFFVPEPAAVVGRSVLLIDDIYTSGATARACSQALRKAGATAVYVATVARAQKAGAAIRVTEPPMEEDIAFWSRGQDQGSDTAQAHAGA